MSAFLPTAPARPAVIRGVGVLLALCVVLATLLHAEQLRRAQLDAVTSDTAASNRALMLSLDHRLHALEREFDRLADLLTQPAREAPMPLTARAAALSRELLHDEQRDALLREVAIADSDGRLLVSSRPGQFGRQLAGLELDGITGGSLHIGRAHGGRYLGDAGGGKPPAYAGVIPVSKTYAVPEGRITVVGLIGADALVTEFRRLVRDERHGLQLYRRDGALLASSSDTPAAATALFEELRRVPHGERIDTAADGSRWITSFRSAGRLPLVAEIRTDYRVATAQWQTDLVAPVVVMAVFLAVILLYTRTALTALAEQDMLARELDSRERRHAGVLANAADGILTMDAGGIVREYNLAAARIFGVPAEAIIGRPLTELLSAPHDSQHPHYVERYLREGQPRIIGTGRKLNTRRRDGAPLDILLSVSETVADGERLFTGIVHDITASERQQRELIAARDAAEAAAASKSRFLALMSHELRTPMTGILGMADLLAEAAGRDEQRRYVGALRGAAQALLTVLNDILDFSKIESGKLVLERSDFDPNRLLDEVREAYAHAAAERDNTLDIARPEGILPALHGDPTRIRQILFNLVSNAVKYTEHGRITVAARASVPPEGGAWTLELAVRDTGIGIPADDIDSLFEPPLPADPSSPLRGGSGLGLTICRRLCDAMGGTIRVDSQVGAGSCFTVSLPLGMAARPVPVASDADAPAAGPGLTILVAEDNAVNRLLIRTRLEAWGHHLTLADNGEEALRQVREAAQPFDIIVMDMHMPVLDGIAATRAIRALPAPAGRTPIIALTADTMPEFRDESLAAGLDAYLTKPVDWAALRQCLAQHARRPAGAPKVDAGGTVLPPPGQLASADPALVDPGRLEELAGAIGDAGLRELVATLFDTCGDALAALHAAQAAGDTEARRRQAHSIKGAARNVGYHAVADAARRLEKGSGDEVPALIAQLEQALARSPRHASPGT